MECRTEVGAVRRNERGQALVMFAILATVILGGLALVIDVGQMYMARRQLQSVADLAALAGAQSLPGNAVQGAYDYAVKNRVDPGVPAANHVWLPNEANGVLRIDWPPIEGNHVGDSKFVAVQVKRSVPALFSFVFGATGFPISARAVARNTTDFGDSAIISLSDRCSPTPLTFSGTSEMLVEGGGAWSNGAAAVTGGADVVLEGPLASAEECGGVTVTGTSELTAPATPEHSLPMGDPLAGLLHPAWVSGDNRVGNVYYPGTYGNTTINQNSCLVTGVYRFGRLNINKDLYSVDSADACPGPGQPLDPKHWAPVLIFADGNITINSGTTVRLKAGVGNFNSVLLWSTGNVTIDGNADVQLRGTIYAPQGAVTLAGNSEVPVLEGQIIGNTVSVTGTSSTVIRYTPAYRAVPAVARLVE